MRERKRSCIRFFTAMGVTVILRLIRGVAEKLQRLTVMDVDTVHLGVCTVKREAGTLCPTINILAEQLLRKGMEIVVGTH